MQVDVDGILFHNFTDQGGNPAMRQEMDRGGDNNF